MKHWKKKKKVWRSTPKKIKSFEVFVVWKSFSPLAIYPGRQIRDWELGINYFAQRYVKNSLNSFINSSSKFRSLDFGVLTLTVEKKQEKMKISKKGFQFRKLAKYKEKTRLTYHQRGKRSASNYRFYPRLSCMTNNNSKKIQKKKSLQHLSCVPLSPVLNTKNS